MIVRWNQSPANRVDVLNYEYLKSPKFFITKEPLWAGALSWREIFSDAIFDKSLIFFIRLVKKLCVGFASHFLLLSKKLIRRIQISYQKTGTIIFPDATYSALFGEKPTAFYQILEKRTDTSQATQRNYSHTHLLHTIDTTHTKILETNTYHTHRYCT